MSQHHNKNTINQQPVLLVDDEPKILQSTSLLLRTEGFQKVLTLDRSEAVTPLLDQEQVAVIVLDLTMPGMSGIELLEQISADHPEIPVLIMTAVNDIETAVQCMQSGAYDYLVKPVDKERLVSSLHRALEIHSLQNEVSSLKRSLLSSKLQNPNAVENIITQNAEMQAIFRYMEAIATSTQPVLITGETGTGKELFARAMHELLPNTGNFVADNVAGLDDSIFADTLFGHTKGAFTGADKARKGLVARAEDGTLFLDEIGDLTASSQIKLLRLLQEHSYFPIGSDTPGQSSARIIVATHCDIDALTEQGTFRKDLYYRLHAHRIHIPPLRERTDDLPLLMMHFLEKASASLDKKIPTPPPELITLLKSYAFPGNVRELESMVHNAVALHEGGVLSMSSFREAIGQPSVTASENQTALEPDRLENLFPDRLPTLKEAEQYLIDKALERAEGNQGIAASILGMSRQALNKRLVRKNSDS